MRDPYTYWWKALELTSGTRSLTRDEMRSLDLTSEPQCGFFRRRVASKGAFLPVAIWKQDDDMIALVDGSAADAAETWSYCCPHPVTEEVYSARAAGKPWPDEHVLPPSGHNHPPEDEAEILKGQIEAAAAGAGDYAEIANDETARKAQSLRARLNELGREADKKREAEKRPHLEASKATDAKWQPLVKAAKAAADAIAKALGAHETRKAKSAQSVSRERTEPPPPVATIRGAYGRAASVKVVKIAHMIDRDAVYQFFRADPDVVCLLAKLAQRGVDAGHTIPGVEISEERKVA